jgi:hypothetical protein
MGLGGKTVGQAATEAAGYVLPVAGGNPALVAGQYLYNQSQGPAPEGAAAQPTVVTEPPGGQQEVIGEGEQQTQKHFGERKGPLKEPRGGEGPTPFTAKGTLYSTDPALNAAMQARQFRIQQAEELRVLSELRAMGATEQEMRAWNEIQRTDAEAGRNLYENHFRVARDRIDSIQQKVDQARALKINPFHWQESIGRGGRVAAAFAALTGGFAAGAGDPNSAVAIMDAAIERDVKAQESNLKNLYDALAYDRTLSLDERQLYAEQVQAFNEVRTMAYAAVLGRLNAIQQGALTEAHHLVVQTARDHYELKLLMSLSELQKEILRIEVSDPIRGAAELAQLKQQMAAMQQQLQVPGQYTVPTADVSLPSGETIAQAPEVAPRGEAIVARGVEAPQAAPGRAGAVAARRPPEARKGEAARVVAPPAAAPTGAPSAPAQRGVEDEAAGVSRPMTEEEARAAEAPKAAPARQAPRGRVLAERAKRELHVEPWIADRFGSIALAEVAQEGSGRTGYGVTTWEQALEDYEAGRPIRNGGMSGTPDAEVFAHFAPPPNPNLYAGGTDSATYKMALEHYNFGKRFPEVYERRTSFGEERSTIVTPGGKVYRVVAGARDAKTYERLRADVTKAETFVRGLYNMAKIVRHQGLSGIATGEGFELPGITTDDPTSMEFINFRLVQAMDFIKTQDPTARLSNEDVKQGLQAMAPFLTKKMKFIDLLQSINGIEDNNVRHSVERFMAALAVETIRGLRQSLANDVVPDFEGMKKEERDIEQIDNWIAGTERAPTAQ